MKELREVKDSEGKQMKFSHIAKELNKRGIKTKEGKEWTHVQVMRILQGKCIPKTTKGCKQKQGNQKQEQLINNVVDKPQNTIIQENITTKNSEQDMKDYLEFLNFKRMKESFAMNK